MLLTWLSTSLGSWVRRKKIRAAPRPSVPRRFRGSLAGTQLLECRALMAGFGEPTILVGSMTDDGSGGTTLREAVELANATPGPDVIDFAENLAGGAIVLTGGQLDLTDDVAIQGVCRRGLRARLGLRARSGLR